MTPHEELRTYGQFDEAGYNLIFELTCQELRSFRGLQPAADGDDAVWELVDEFFVERGRAVVTMLLAQALDDDSLGRLLRRSLRNWLIDQVRKTDRGALRRRLERLIKEDDRFEEVPGGQPGAGRWRLAGSDGQPAGPPLAGLRAAARAVRDVRVPPWTGQERRAPAADEPSLGRIMLAVLTEAGGSLEPGTVAAVFADRLPNALDPAEERLVDRAAEMAGGPETDDPARAIMDRQQIDHAARLARDFAAQLSPEERRLLPHLTSPIEEQMKATGRGRSQTYLRVSALRERLRSLLGEEENRVLAADELLKLCADNNQTTGLRDIVPDSHGDMPSVAGDG